MYRKSTTDVMDADIVDAINAINTGKNVVVGYSIGYADGTKTANDLKRSATDPDVFDFSFTRTDPDRKVKQGNIVFDIHKAAVHIEMLPIAIGKVVNFSWSIC